MLNLFILIATCSASQVSFKSLQNDIVVSDQINNLNSDTILDIHRMAIGADPEHIINEKVFETFNPFNPSKKAVIVICPSMPENSLSIQNFNGHFISESIEISFKEDVSSVLAGTSDDHILVLKVTSNEFVNELERHLTELFDGDFMISYVVDNDDLTSDTSADRQILEADEPNKLGATLPRNMHFPVIFVFTFALLLVMVFVLVWMSYEMAMMEPGDNIAYKLGAAQSKKMN